MNAFRVKAHKMGAVFAGISSYAGIDAEQVCIRTVGAFT